jgi:hypothetical protein
MTFSEMDEWMIEQRTHENRQKRNAFACVTVDAFPRF